ncbi:MAG: HEAT repeat domain-containing protein [Planctomycetes bacterium]|nr:HEAT repeat domain-containing protein [Planctomycetota bacterium]
MSAEFILCSEDIIVGQPLFAELIIRNKSDTNFVFTSYSRSQFVRSYDYSIEVINDQGNLLNPGPEFMAFSGSVHATEIKSGAEYRQGVFLNRWHTFHQPGVYTIVCRRRLQNFRKQDALRLSVSKKFTINVRMHDSEKFDIVLNVHLEGIQSEDSNTVSKSCAALSVLRTERIIEPLKKILDTGTRIQKRFAIDGLSQFSSIEMADIFVHRLIEDHNELGYYLCDVLKKMGQSIRIVDICRMSLSNPGVDIGERKNLIKVLGMSRSQTAINDLLVLSKDNDDDIRYAAVRALGILGYTGLHKGNEVVDKLLLYVSGDDMSMRVVAAESLQKIGHPFQIAWLIPAVKKAQHANVRSFHDAMTLIRLYGGEAARPALIRCLNFDDVSGTNSINFFLIYEISATKGGPTYYKRYHHDPNRKATAVEINKNRKLFKELKQWLKTAHFKEVPTG